MGKIYIKCFQTPGSRYFYDRYTDSVIGVSEEEYKELLQVEQSKQITEGNNLSRFIDNGLLKKTIVCKIEHPETSQIKYLLKNKIADLILQVTQQCNLRCEYCAYSGIYYNRGHSNNRMTLDIAKKAIDFYLERSKESEKLCLSFYGGEPLLEWSLIKECVLYVVKNKGEQPISFHMTTNATLLTKEKLDFIIKYKFHIMISLDGDKESHDLNRKFISGIGSFDIVYKNLIFLKNYNESYYRNYVLFNSVISSKNNIESTLDFFSNAELFAEEVVNLNSVDPTDIKEQGLVHINTVYRENQIVEDFEYFKMLLSLTGKRKWDAKSKIMRKHAADIELLYQQLHRHNLESQCMHHNGPCIPGVKRLFVETNGTFFPCERVSESNKTMSIGSLKKDFDLDRIDYYINHGKIIENECLDCWNLRRCLFCIAGVDKKNNVIKKNSLIKKCIKSKERSMRLMYSLCILVELGYRGNDNLKIMK